MGFWEELFLFCSVPIVGGVCCAMAGIFTHHRRKMEEMRQKEKRQIGVDIQAEFEKLRGEIRDLRDVSMQYDLSFDNALQQMEHRLAHLERPQYGQQHSAAPTENVLRGGQK